MLLQNESNDSNRVEFIGREDKLNLIQKCIFNKNVSQFLMVDGEGGIGKTRLLNEVPRRFSTNPEIIFTNVYDFDDPVFHHLENIKIKIAEDLGKEKFNDYFQKFFDYQHIQSSSVAYEQLDQYRKELDKLFLHNFNTISLQKRIVLRFDTCDALQNETGIIVDFLVLAISLHNAVIIVAGRNAQDIGKNLNISYGKQIAQFIKLSPFSKTMLYEYINEKRKNIAIPPLQNDLEEKLVYLSAGKPILLDLAVEWIARGIELDWMVNISLNAIQEFSEKEKRRRYREFEIELLNPIAETSSSIHWVFLLLAWVHLLNGHMLAFLRNISINEANELLQTAKTYVFVKQLPDHRFKLHDEMHRMIEEYVWPKVDQDGEIRKHFSRKATEYFAIKRRDLIKEAISLKKKELEIYKLSPSKTAFESSLEYQLSVRHKLVLDSQYLKHSLFVGPNKQSLTVFKETFDDAFTVCKYGHCKELLNQISSQHYLSHFTDEQRIDIDLRNLKYLYATGKFQKTYLLANDLLSIEVISSKQKVEILLIRGNTAIRLGNIAHFEEKSPLDSDAVKDFTRAVAISHNLENFQLYIKSLNALGWAYRLIGDLKSAEKYYLKAKNFYYQIQKELVNTDHFYQKELRQDFCWINNNLAGILSYKDSTSHIAVELAAKTLADWNELGNDIGLGACYLVLGIAYYRREHFTKALFELDQARLIFEALDHNDWLGQVYCWQGKVYYKLKETNKALEKLEKSYKIGSGHIMAMTLNRLAQVHMYHHNWEEAESLLNQSIEAAKEIPDYPYLLSSIAHLIAVVSEKEPPANFKEYEKLVTEVVDQVPFPDPNYEGAAYISLAKLALNGLKKDVNLIADYLQKGIVLIIENKSSLSRDITKQLKLIEESFSRRQLEGDIIRDIGQKVINRLKDNILYMNVINHLRKWADWNEKNLYSSDKLVETLSSAPSVSFTLSFPTEQINRSEEFATITKPNSAPYFLVNAPSGYGKTQFLRYIAENAPKNSFPIYITLSGYTNLDLSQLARLIIDRCNPNLFCKANVAQVGLELKKAAHNNQKDEILICLDEIDNLSSDCAKELLNDFIPTIANELKNNHPLPIKLKIILASRYPANWIYLRSEIILKLINLTPLDYDSVNQLAQQYIQQLIAPDSSLKPHENLKRYTMALMWNTGGHPGAIVKIVTGGNVESNLFSNQKKLYENILKSVIDEIRRDQIPNHLRNIFETLSPIRKFNPNLLQNFIDSNLFSWSASPFELEEELLKTHLFSIEEGFIINAPIRRLLTIQTRNAQSQKFQDACCNAICFFQNQLKKKIFRPELYALEIIFLELQRLTVSKDKQLDKIISFFKKTVDHLRDDSAEKQLISSFKSFKQYLSEDWELEFFLNYLFPDYTFENLQKDIL